MKRNYLISIVVVVVCLILASCSFPPGSDTAMESTRIALAIQQTSLAMDQTRVAQSASEQDNEEVSVQPTYTPYPTYTSQAPQVTEAPVVTEEPEPVMSFDDWLNNVDILLYDDLYGFGEMPVIENALDGMSLGSNIKNVGGAMGDFLSNLNSAIQWDLIIVASEARGAISGEYFDVLADHIDRGVATIIEIWYIDDIASGRIQPVMQRCGISYQRDWQRNINADLNEYLIYLLEPTDPLFSQPNTMSMLIPSASYMWTGDVGDMVELNAGSDAVLMAGVQPKEYSSYGMITECLDGRMIWQTFCTHDYKTDDMINMWQNYIYNSLLARYNYLYN